MLPVSLRNSKLNRDPVTEGLSPLPLFPSLPTAATGPVPGNLSAALAYGRVKVNSEANLKCGFLSEMHIIIL